MNIHTVQSLSDLIEFNDENVNPVNPAYRKYNIFAVVGDILCILTGNIIAITTSIIANIHGILPTQKKYVASIFVLIIYPVRKVINNPKNKFINTLLK